MSIYVIFILYLLYFGYFFRREKKVSFFPFWPKDVHIWNVKATSSSITSSSIKFRMALRQGCHMVYLRYIHLSTTSIIMHKYLMALRRNILVHFGHFWYIVHMAIWYFRGNFGILYLHVAIWYFCGNFGTFLVLVCCTKKNLATLLSRVFIFGIFKLTKAVLLRRIVFTRVARFLGTIYQSGEKYTKWLQNYQLLVKYICISNGNKIFKMTRIYSNILHFKVLQNISKLVFLVRKETIWQPWFSLDHEKGRRGCGRASGYCRQTKGVFTLNTIFSSLDWRCCRTASDQIRINPIRIRRCCMYLQHGATQKSCFV
jgi:hypothetical protein